MAVSCVLHSKKGRKQEMSKGYFIMVICEANLDRNPSRLLTTPQQPKTQRLLMTHRPYFQAKLEHHDSTKARNQKYSSSDQRLARVVEDVQGRIDSI